MADVLTSQADVELSFPIIKTEKTADGDLLVYGKVTDGTIDADDQIVDPQWSAKALQDWLMTGANLRVQHQAMRDPAGVGLEVEVNRDGDNAHWLKALVVEPVAKRLVEKGALRAFSVGIMRPKIFTHAKARGGLIGGGDLGEVSLVDRPANKNCAFTLVKADKSGHASWVGKMEGDEAVIKKMLTPTPADVAKAISNGKATEPPVPEQGNIAGKGMFADPIANRLAQAIADDKAIEKRQFTAAQRQAADRSGHAMPGGGYPIDNVGDLHNAIQAIGRAKNPSGTRAHIKRRAAELGRSDLIPDGWKGLADTEDMLSKAVADGTMTVNEARAELGLDPFDFGVTKDAGDSGSTCPSCNGKGTIRGGGMKCPKCKGTGKMTMTKGDMSDVDDGVAAHGMSDDDDDDDDNDDKKGKAWECSECGTKAYKGASFCSGCGASFKGRGAPGAGAQTGGARSKKTKPVPGHRNADVVGDPPPSWQTDTSEPEGGGSGIMGGGIGANGASLAQRKTQAPYAMVRAHDAFCPAFDFADVLKEYPSLTNVMDAVNVTEIQEAALKAVSAGELERGEQLLRVARGADELKAADPGLVLDARAELHKGFQSMYPDVKLTPGSIMPGQFQRGYVTSGHAAPSSDRTTRTGGPPVPTQANEASNFRRGALTTGHAAMSPANKADPARVAPPGSGFWHNDSRESAARALELMHDHIQSSFPELCPQSPEHVYTNTPMPAPVGKTATMVKPKKGKKPSGGSSAGAAQQAALDAAVKSMAEIAQGVLEVRQQQAGTGESTHAEALKAAAAQLATVAATLSEKSAEGKVSGIEAAELRAQVADLHRIIAQASAQSPGSNDARAMKAAAVKLEKAAEALSNNGASVAMTAADQVEKILADAKLEKLQEQLTALGLKIETRSPYDPAAPDNLAKAAEQLAKAAAALSEPPKPQRWEAPAGWDTPQDGAMRSLAGKVEKLQDQLAALVGASQGFGMREDIQAQQAVKAMSAQLEKVTADLTAMRTDAMMTAQARDLEYRAKAAAVKKAKKPKEARALKAAVAALTKAAATMTTHSEPAAVPPAAGDEDIARKISELQDLVSKMASAPDPAQAPVRGITIGNDNSSTVAPVERRSLVDEAMQRTVDEKYRFLKSLTASGDPQVREQAQAQINKMQAQAQVSKMLLS